MAKFLATPVDHDPFAEPTFASSTSLEGSSPVDLEGAKPLREFWPELGHAIQSEPGKILNSLAAAVTAPQRALSGDFNQLEISPQGAVSPFDPRLVGEATNMAGVVSEGGLASPRPRESLGMFGGINAKTADLGALRTAMGAEGRVSPKDIWDRTGWFKGSDGKWKFEIPDEKSTMDVTKLLDQGSAKMGEVLHHPELYAAYPSLAEIPVKTVHDPAIYGQYNPEENSALLSTPFNSMHGPHSTMLHELQHAVQSREDFAMGGSPDDPSFRGAYHVVLDKAQQIKSSIEDQFYKWAEEKEGHSVTPGTTAHHWQWIKFMEAFPDTYKKYKEAHQIVTSNNANGEGLTAYLHLAGEVESRNVQKRAFDPSTIGTLPTTTEDRPRWSQILRTVPDWRIAPHSNSLALRSTK